MDNNDRNIERGEPLQEDNLRNAELVQETSQNIQHPQYSGQTYSGNIQNVNQVQGMPQGVQDINENAANMQGEQIPLRRYGAVPPPYPYYGAYPPPPVYAPPKKKRLSTGWVIGITTVITVMFITIVVLCFAVAKKSAEYSKTKGETTFGSQTQTAADKKTEKYKNHVQITIPTSPRPVLESRYYEDEESGLLTTQGVAEMVMPSQVLIGVYNDTPYQMSSLGSGIIISTDGYILTNAHVVDEAQRFKAQLWDGRQFEASLVGIDRTNDIAVVKIDAEDLISAEIGKSDNVILGEQVAVVGAGGSLENSITFGYVSALGREIETDYSSSGKLNCIQTDAALNPGNSGGALVNMYGQVIGISVGGLNHQYYDGIGFAIEIDDAVAAAENLIAYGYIPGRAKLGISFISINAEVAEEFGIEAGLCVMEVDPSCDIASKDIQPYDIITEIDGKPVRNLDSVMEILNNKTAGETVTLTVYRKTITEEIQTFEVTAKLEQKFD